MISFSSEPTSKFFLFSLFTISASLDYSSLTLIAKKCIQSSNTYPSQRSHDPAQLRIREVGNGERLADVGLQILERP